MNKIRNTVTCIILAFALTLSGCSTKWVNVALQDLPVIVNLANAIVMLANPSFAPDVKEYAVEAQTDLQLVQAILVDYNKQTATEQATRRQRVQALLTDVSSHLSAILAASHIRNDVTAQHVTAAVNLSILTVNTILALVGGTSTTQHLTTPDELRYQVHILELDSLHFKSEATE